MPKPRYIVQDSGLFTSLFSPNSNPTWYHCLLPHISFAALYSTSMILALLFLPSEVYCAQLHINIGPWFSYHLLMITFSLRCSRARHPLTMIELSRLISEATKLQLSGYNVALFRALFLTMFHCFLQASEVTKHAHNLPFSGCIWRLSQRGIKIIFSSSKSSGCPASISINATGK